MGSISPNNSQRTGKLLDTFEGHADIELAFQTTRIYTSEME
jgi:hypothetical protein